MCVRLERCKAAASLEVAALCGDVARICLLLLLVGLLSVAGLLGDVSWQASLAFGFVEKRKDEPAPLNIISPWLCLTIKSLSIARDGKPILEQSPPSHSAQRTCQGGLWQGSARQCSKACAVNVRLQCKGYVTMSKLQGTLTVSWAQALQAQVAGARTSIAGQSGLCGPSNPAWPPKERS